jgi:hypothetical protein
MGTGDMHVEAAFQGEVGQAQQYTLPRSNWAWGPPCSAVERSWGICAATGASCAPAHALKHSMIRAMRARLTCFMSIFLCLERVMHFLLPAKTREGSEHKAQGARQYGYCKRPATRWAGPSLVFPPCCPGRPALAALRRLPRHEPWRRTAPCDHQPAGTTPAEKSA